MKKITMITLLSLFTLTIQAQGFVFGDFQKSQREKVRSTVDAPQKVKKEVASRSNKPLIEEYSEIQDGYKYRYVYAYNERMERTSETIYRQEYSSSDNTWGKEEMYAIGNYSYEYNGEGRIKVKNVTYEYGNEEGGEFDSYRIMVTYNSDGSATYKKYEQGYDGYQPSEEWTYRADGTLATYNSDYSEGSEDFNNKVSYNNHGQIIGYGNFSYTGTQNSRNIYEDHTEEMRFSSYTYDDNGNLTELIAEETKYTFEYDEYGRIACISEYGPCDDDSAIITPMPDIPNGKTRSANDGTEWELRYEEKYEYFNDEVYDITNSWKAIFMFDGPVTKYTYHETDMYSEEESTYVMEFVRNENGIITEIRRTPQDETDNTNITIDSNGHITEVNENYTKNIFKWDNGKITECQSVTEYNDEKENYRYERTTSYEYGENYIHIRYINPENNYIEQQTLISQTDDTYILKNWYGNDEFDIENDELIIKKTQKEDVSFIMPNLKKGIEGFTPESPVFISNAGRTVVLCNNISYWDGYFYCEYDGNYYFQNIYSKYNEYDDIRYIMGKYFSISHDEEYTICKDYQERPIYVLKGDKLIKEFKYYYKSTNVSPAKKRSANILNGWIYDEITYIYNEEGVLTGMNFVSVDEDGVRTNEYTLEYKYSTTGIKDIEISTRPMVEINGRTIGFKEGVHFNIMTTDGKLVAKDVCNYTFNTEGIYIITDGTYNVKIVIK